MINSTMIKPFEIIRTHYSDFTGTIKLGMFMAIETDVETNNVICCKLTTNESMNSQYCYRLNPNNYISYIRGRSAITEISYIQLDRKFTFFSDRVEVIGKINPNVRIAIFRINQQVHYKEDNLLLDHLKYREEE